MENLGENLESIRDRIRQVMEEATLSPEHRHHLDYSLMLIGAQLDVLELEAEREIQEAEKAFENSRSGNTVTYQCRMVTRILDSLGVPYKTAANNIERFDHTRAVATIRGKTYSCATSPSGAGWSFCEVLKAGEDDVIRFATPKKFKDWILKELYPEQA